MAAETLTATRAAESFPVAKGHSGGTLHVAWGTYAVAAAVEAGDIFEMCKVPAGATIMGGYLQCEDLDTGTEALDMMVGWAANGTDAADPNGLMLAHVFSGDISVHLDVASSLVFFGGVMTGAGPKTLAAETTIQVEVNTAANVFAAGQVTLVVYYTCN
jgi:hypothetical protein